VRFHDSNADGDLSDPADNTLYYTTDANWNVTGLVDTGGQVVERYSYTPYGEVSVLTSDWQPVTNNQSAYDNQILYAGYRFDAESGLYQVRNRYYHPTLGRFANRDPIGYAGGANLYGYCGESPTGATDAMGLRGPWTSSPDYFWYDIKEFLTGGVRHASVRVHFTESFAFGPDQTSAVAQFSFPIQNDKQVSLFRRAMAQTLEGMNEEVLISDLQSVMSKWPTGRFQCLANEGKWAEAGKAALGDAALLVAPAVLIRNPVAMQAFRLYAPEASGTALVIERAAAGLGAEAQAAANMGRVLGSPAGRLFEVAYGGSIPSAANVTVTIGAVEQVTLRGAQVAASGIEGSAGILTLVNDTRGWRVGDPINNLTAAGDVPSWSAVRERIWKNEAFFNASNYSVNDLSRMRGGLAPQQLNPRTGQLESMELHHWPPQRAGGLFDVEKVWPNRHARIDPFRQLGD
jgi:RHS repeat-associated protein